MAKQTGRCQKVKFARGAVLLSLGVILTGLSACADAPWYNPRKSAEEVKADHKTCNQRAEDAAMLRNRQSPADYKPPMPPGQSGAYRADTPMDLAERGSTAKTFERQFENCMTSKGYSREKPAAKPQ